MTTLLDYLGELIFVQSLQVTMLVVLLLVACWFLRRASAHWRYLLWLIVVFKCLIPPIMQLNVPLLPAGPTTAEAESAIQASLPTIDQPHDSPVQVNWKQQDTLQGTTLGTTLGTTAHAIDRADTTPVDAAEVRVQHSRMLTARQWLVALWLGVVGIILTQTMWRIAQTSYRLRELARDLDHATRDEVHALALSLGLRRAPPVYRVDGIAQPFVWGWWRGAVYLPASFTQVGTADGRRAILIHELAHVVRWDVLVNHLQNLVQTLFFFHPLVWLVNYKLRQEREKCCDEVVLATSHLLPTVYCEAIVSMLAREVSSRSSTAALAATGSLHSVKERIATMLTPMRKFRQRPSRAAYLMTLTLAAILLPTALRLTEPSAKVLAQEAADKPAIPPAGARAVSTWPAGQTMDFRVVHAETQEPLGDVTLELQNMGPGIDFGDVKIQKTDADGWSRIPLPDLPPTAVRVYPLKDGFVPLRIYWNGTPHPIMPKTITIPLTPGKKFGGVVQNQQGQGIADVEVTIDFWADGQGKDPHIRANINRSVKTDKDGRWQVDCMPAEIDNEDSLRIYLYHPDYVSDYKRRGISPTPVTQRPPVKQLFDESSVMVMRSGESMEGIVVDAQGQPIAEAAIYNTEYYWVEPARPRATTDKFGKFNLRGFEYSATGGPGVILTVHAKGHAPELVFVDPGSPPLQVQLRHGKTLRGLIVDEENRPIPGVHIEAGRWREQSHRLGLHAETNTQGEFALEDVPIDEVIFLVYKEGYMIRHDFVSTAESPVKLILRAPVKITGAVTDAETGKPIEKFQLIKGWDYEDGRNPSWMPWATESFNNQDTYQAELNQAELSWRLRIEAEGYMPAETRIFRLNGDDKGTVRYDFKLKKSAPLTGTVLGVDGKPLADAEVCLAPDRVNINDRKILYHSGLKVKSAADGRFAFPPEVEPFCIVVVHEQGIGMITEAECQTPSQIKLEPWTEKNSVMQIIRMPAKGQMRHFP